MLFFCKTQRASSVSHSQMTQEEQDPPSAIEQILRFFGAGAGTGRSSPNGYTPETTPSTSPKPSRAKTSSNNSHSVNNNNYDALKCDSKDNKTSSQKSPKQSEKRNTLEVYKIMGGEGIGNLFSIAKCMYNKAWLSLNGYKPKIRKLRKIRKRLRLKITRVIRGLWIHNSLPLDAPTVPLGLDVTVETHRAISMWKPPKNTGGYPEGEIEYILQMKDSTKDVWEVVYPLLFLFPPSFSFFLLSWQFVLLFHSSMLPFVHSPLCYVA
jgi:hypothetical protein